jgi:hypothetical protein
MVACMPGLSPSTWSLRGSLLGQARTLQSKGAHGYVQGSLSACQTPVPDQRGAPGAQVVEAERRLRGALLLDGLPAGEGYALARYNDPFTPPFLRRNEVLITLRDFELE